VAEAHRSDCGSAGQNFSSRYSHADTSKIGAIGAMSALHHVPAGRHLLSSGYGFTS
jgi:hypothetical protein